MVVAATERIEPCIGPLPVTVRSPAQIALAVGDGRVDGAQDARRARHVERRRRAMAPSPRAGAAAALATAVAEVRALLAGDRVDGFRLRQPPRGATVTVAAFGPRAVEIAASADRMVLNMVTVAAAERLAAQHANTAVWLAAAVDPTAEERAWMALGYVAYLGAAGYAEMFEEAGFGELVAFARTRPHPKELAAAAPRRPPRRRRAGRHGGGGAAAHRGLRRGGSAGDRLVVPPLDLPSGRRTLEALAP